MLRVIVLGSTVSKEGDLSWIKTLNDKYRLSPHAGSTSNFTVKVEALISEKA